MIAAIEQFMRDTAPPRRARASRGPRSVGARRAARGRRPRADAGLDLAERDGVGARERASRRVAAVARQPAERPRSSSARRGSGRRRTRRREAAGARRPRGCGACGGRSAGSGCRPAASRETRRRARRREGGLEDRDRARAARWRRGRRAAPTRPPRPAAAGTRAGRRPGASAERDPGAAQVDLLVGAAAAADLARAPPASGWT